MTLPNLSKIISDTKPGPLSSGAWADQELESHAIEMALLLRRCDKALRYLARNDANGWVRERCQQEIESLAEFDARLKR